MDFSMNNILDSENEMTISASYEAVRFTRVNLMTADEEMSDIWGGLNIPWSKPSDWGLNYMSAVCFLYGRLLHDKLQVPIGLIQSSWGGTPVESWTPSSALEACGTPGSPNFGQSVQNEDSQLWHAMIAPLTRLNIAGAIWYQGETNALNYNTDFYGCNFSKMIEVWRQMWAERTNGETAIDFPFGFVELGTNREQVSDSYPNGLWPLLRWYQTSEVGSVPNQRMPNTFMATAMDTHDPDSPFGAIHPRDKLTVASRLAWAGLNQAYGNAEYPAQGPKLSLIPLEGNLFEVKFDQPVVLNTQSGWQVCKAADSHLCDSVTGWNDTMITITQDNHFMLDLREICKDGCSAVAYLWRETPCLIALQCPIYASDPFRLPATPQLFLLD